MPVTRKFFDWHKPALSQVVDWLYEIRQSNGFVDLSDVLLVVPGRRAGRRFEELLLKKTSGRFAPPQVVTLGQLPEELYEAAKPFANDLTQRLAWADALSGLSVGQQQVLLRNVPDAGDLDRWLALGTMLARHHTELAADGLHFGDVAARGRDLHGFDEDDRWASLYAAQQRYLELLDSLNLWDKQTARLVAIERQECRTDKQILLLAAVDINQAPRQMLDQVAGQVTALIHAPEVLADRFDEHGCLRPELWCDATIEVSAHQVRVVDGPADQAAEVAYVLAGYGGEFRADQITLGVADELLIPHLRRQLDDCGIRSRPVVERGLPQTPPATFLAAVAEYVSDDRVESLAGLMRHPDLEAWLTAQGVQPGWLCELDCYVTEHLQPRLGSWLGEEKRSARLRQAHAEVRRLLAPLIAPPRPLRDWSQPIADLLLEIYRQVEFDEDSSGQRVTLAACRKLQGALHEQTRIPERLSAAFTAAEAIELVLEAVAGEPIPPPVDSQAIPMLGWLELPLDDAPAAIVTSFNEGFVPSSLNADLFLPNRLRKRLGVLDNHRRYARDAYALSVLLHSRENVTLIVGRRTADGDPLKPSRLLFAAEPRVIAERVQQFYSAARSGNSPVRPPLPSLLRATRETPGFQIVRPQKVDRPLDVLSVTAFRRYLACPYRYYLSRVLGLSSMDDTAAELDASMFGELLHDVLATFSLSPLAASDDEPAILAFLNETLDQRTGARLGSARRPAVQLQLEQLRRRLQAFVPKHVTCVQQGWVIRHVEVDFDRDHAVPFDLGDGRQIRLIGRIDRIDYNPQRDLWRIIDYKTEASGKTPDEVHRRKGEWIELQLPLYRHLAERLGVKGDVELAYFLLPENTDRTNISLAGWTEDELFEADKLARQVGRDILDQKFWPPADGVQYDEWMAHCHIDLFDGENLRPVSAMTGATSAALGGQEQTTEVSA